MGNSDDKSNKSGDGGRPIEEKNRPGGPLTGGGGKRGNDGDDEKPQPSTGDLGPDWSKREK